MMMMMIMISLLWGLKLVTKSDKNVKKFGSEQILWRIHG